MRFYLGPKFFASFRKEFSLKMGVRLWRTAAFGGGGCASILDPALAEGLRYLLLGVGVYTSGYFYIQNRGLITISQLETVI